MTGHRWTVEQRDAHAARLKAIFSNPAYKAHKRQKALLRAATAPAPTQSIIPPSVYDYRLDLGTLPVALHDDVIAEAPDFDFGEAA